MGETISHPAWVEHAGGERVPIIGACSIGRAPSNAVVLNDERVSRRHAIIQAQEQGESWLADLGSSNGTYLNGRRLSEPARLADGDRIEVGPFALVFRQPGPVREPGMDPLTEDQTIPALKRATCWLLVADIVGSTRLNQALAAEQVSTLTSDWLTACKQIIAETGGSIDKFLGDGFFAFWPDAPEQAQAVADALGRLREVQAREQPPFRVILHFAEVCISGLATLGKEHLWGADVTFAFRAERLASGLKERRLMSDPARERLGSALPTAEVGWHVLPGYEGKFRFWRF